MNCKKGKSLLPFVITSFKTAVNLENYSNTSTLLYKEIIFSTKTSPSEINKEVAILYHIGVNNISPRGTQPNYKSNPNQFLVVSLCKIIQ